ncbi:MAG TPA: DPP IV N-terminal domain-containing protein [Terriglobales bacterium]|nr:DPP IV N-terminal domain-containing protein [Terriglobales bacterium]
MQFRGLTYSSLSLVALAAVALAVAPLSGGQQIGGGASAVTVADYQHAEKFLPYSTRPLVFHDVRATWLPGDRFWYQDTGPNGIEFVMYDAARGTRQPAFDHAKVAAALSAAAGKSYDAGHLPFTTFEFSTQEKAISFRLLAQEWKCDLEADRCVAEGKRGESGHGPNPSAKSPDGKSVAFIRDWNLWLRDIASGKETQLTTDGVKDFGYATDNAGWIHSDNPILLWSPDSKKIATFQQDQRGVGEMYLVETKIGHPKLEAWKYPLPGDEVVTTIQRVVIDLDGPKVIRLQLPPDQHRSTLCDDLECHGGDWADVEWSPDAKHLAFVSTSRDHKHEQLQVADAANGAVRHVLEETVATQFESGQGRVNWHYLPASSEVIWCSERDGWSHLYLYDLATGKLKNQITSGEWAVTQVLRVDEKNRQVYLLADGREKGNPYFRHLYRVGFDGKNLALLTPEDGNHEIAMSPSGLFFVDSYSKPEVPSVTVVRDESGKLVSTVGREDISRLIATGWKPPIPIMVKARDNGTDLYGLMFEPTSLDRGKKYPIINNIYPGPQGGSVHTWSFSSASGDCQALAELGFVVVQIEGMGNPLRSKKFHDFYYGNMGDNTLPDQVAGMRELAAKYPWIDIGRVGIWGHSGGGFATAAAMFRYPDFFKVGISESGNQDNREYEDDWGERYQGLLVKKADGTTNYDDQANENLAKNLKGHLLLAHGMMDDNVPPYNTLLVVDALIKANKDFDLLLLPDQPHGYGAQGYYMTRRRWDYFVRYLLGVEPPHEYELHPPESALGPQS